MNHQTRNCFKNLNLVQKMISPYRLLFQQMISKNTMNFGNEDVAIDELASRQASHRYQENSRCPYCTFESNHTKFLAAHVRTHTNQKTYPCNLCPYIADRLSNLKAHFRRHTGEKPYTCLVCGKAFTLHQTMHSHLAAKHPESASAYLKCSHCKIKSASDSSNSQQYY